MKAIRLHLRQNSANYRREETVNCRMTYPLPPYSTVIGALHKACGYTEYHPMQLSIQGRYGSLISKMFKEDCFLNRLEDDRGILVKMCSTDILSSAYTIAAKAQKSQGNSFDKGITINIVNQSLLDEYRFLKRTKKRIDAHKKLIKLKKDKAKSMSDKEFSQDEIKRYSEKIKILEKAYKKYEEEKYSKPISRFRILTKAPKYYEILCDVELVIHVISDEQTMNDILKNVGNLMAIGRGEDFVEIIDVCETELEFAEKRFVNKKHSAYSAYIPMSIIENCNKKLRLNQETEGIIKNGTKYLINKDYVIEGKNESQKRVFNKVSVLYTSNFDVKTGADEVYIDKDGENIYSVFFA